MTDGSYRPTYNQQQSETKRCYHIFCQYINGHLARGIQVELPSCIMEKVRVKYPNEGTEEYVGFREN
jgi:hypothetical protein